MDAKRMQPTVHKVAGRIERISTISMPAFMAELPKVYSRLMQLIQLMQLMQLILMQLMQRRSTVPYLSSRSLLLSMQSLSTTGDSSLSRNHRCNHRLRFNSSTCTTQSAWPKQPSEKFAGFVQCNASSHDVLLNNDRLIIIESYWIPKA